MANKLLLALLFATTINHLGAAMPTSVITPPPAEPTPTHTLNCDYEYCDGSTSWCFYWAGISSYDPTLGPLPGESRTSVGTCAYPPKTPAPPAPPAPTPA